MTLDGIETEVRLVQLEKVQSLIMVTPLGMETEVRLLQFWKE